MTTPRAWHKLLRLVSSWFTLDALTVGDDADRSRWHELFYDVAVMGCRSFDGPPLLGASAGRDGKEIADDGVSARGRMFALLSRLMYDGLGGLDVLMAPEIPTATELREMVARGRPARVACPPTVDSVAARPTASPKAAASSMRVKVPFLETLATGTTMAAFSMEGSGLQTASVRGPDRSWKSSVTAMGMIVARRAWSGGRVERGLMVAIWGGGRGLTSPWDAPDGQYSVQVPGPSSILRRCSRRSQPTSARQEVRPLRSPPR